MSASHFSPLGYTRLRWLTLVVGAAMLVVGLSAGYGPFERSREFRQAVECDCFDREAATIVGRRVYTTTSTYTDANGAQYANDVTHYELTWERPGSGRTVRDVSQDVYDRTADGGRIDLRTWRGEVVAVEAGGAVHRFLPEPGRRMVTWFWVAWFGLGALLWAVLFGWWDGFTWVGGRLFAWAFLAYVLGKLGSDAVVEGFDTGWALAGDVVAVFFAFLLAGFILLAMTGYGAQQLSEKESR
jgi:hypothetical protein